MPSPIYLDYNATTPVAEPVQDAMIRCLRDVYGNPSSSYAQGQQAAGLVAEARSAVATLIGAQPEQLVFTGCATEANNLALLGVASALAGEKRHLVISAIEHPAVLEPALHLQRQGWDLTLVPVDSQGQLSVSAVVGALRPDTALVSIMHANNEIGTIQPIAEIAREARARGILVHTDAAQSVGKVAIDVDELGVDLLTLAGHKFYAAKGVGALYVRPGTPINNILFGAGQEHQLRPGTENVPAIVGMGAAAQLAMQRMGERPQQLQQLRDALHQRLQQAIPGLVLNGHPQARLPNTLNISFPGVSGRDLLQVASADVVASVGSACHSEQATVSGVLAALGVDATRAAGAVRLSTGWGTTAADIEHAAQALIQAWKQLS